MYTIREFRKHLARILDECENNSVHIDRKGKIYEIKRVQVEKKVIEKEDSIKKTYSFIRKVNPKMEGFLQYGCGCGKDLNKPLCGTHGRY